MSERAASGGPSGPPRRESRMTTSRARALSRVGGVVLLVTALLAVLQGITALGQDEPLSDDVDYSYALDLTAWGWIHLVVGVLAAVVAVGVLTGATWGLVTGLIVAGSSMLANFAFLPVYPLWAIVVIGFDVLVVWALCELLRDAEGELSSVADDADGARAGDAGAHVRRPSSSHESAPR